jgi:type IV pilus assembly protein PilV
MVLRQAVINRVLNMNFTMTMNKVKNQKGVSLIEVLVTLVLISVALLGSASLQVVSKRANNQALQRSAAAHFANDYLSKMRSNRPALATYVPAGDLGAASLGTAPAKGCVGADTNCTSADLAAFDQWQWEQELDGATELVAGAKSGGLLEPTACITGPAAGAAGVYEIAIAWRGNTEHVNPTIHDCGEDSGKYGTDNNHRHVLVMNTFIDNN